MNIDLANMTSPAMAFDQLPAGSTTEVSPFHVSVTDDALSELKMFLSLSKLAPVTYEGLQDRKYGVPHRWLKNAKSVWLKDFDWYTHTPVHRPGLMGDPGESMKPI